MTQNLQIRKMTQQDMLAWDKYVDHHQDGTFFHLTGWYTVIHSVFKHKPQYLLAERDHNIVGVLPLFEQKSAIFGHALISTPFCVYGGVLADSDAIRHKLEKSALELGASLNVDYVELRDKTPRESEGPWVAHCQHATFSSVLSDSPDQILTDIKRKQRAVIRHSLKNNLKWDNKDDTSCCYDVYAQSVHNLGTPVFNKKLFDSLKETFAERCETLVIHNDKDTPVSSVLSFYYKDTVLPYYGGGTHDARDLKSNDYMYYQLMCIAKDKGMTQFDFGRSKKDSGSYQYKKHWGMQENNLHYRIALIKAKNLPNLSPNNPKYRILIGLWKKMPLSLSRQIGPQLSKYLG
ncbi:MULTISPECIES: FemAB family XrtA/PEP-CTERM system-associated protein [Vibrio]|jgi:FemAB-related protein (PEP-CTERM system-associated)|uniref:FemAB family XrtA/PEP-CTERM system-associated protein n=1 Tax=Vibrio TaxID=662 RepID=UPI000BFF981F|nr:MULTISPECIES: FemAB family XrtA/PEP-CTERM system-associated protein [unclassified Vibrio]PHJ41840.1 peptidoglycan bridge formation protein FemAB [Vibrio sp. PID17_43]RIZ53019.1 peptidoglycan bridge formation protein FemAB [Vibrio sp. PID23_8]